MINLSTSAFYARATSQISGLRAQANDIQTQIGTGNRLSRSSDDPVAAARLRTLSRGERLAEIDQRNSDRAQQDLKLTDDALESVANIIAHAQELAMQAGTDTLNPEQRASIGQELMAMRDALLTVANGRNGTGFALFGGQSSGAAYEDTGSGIAYIGTSAVDPADLGAGQSIAPALTGPEVFSIDGAPGDLFAVIGNLASVLRDGGDASAAAQDALSGLSAGLDKVTTAQTVVGARLTWIDLMDQRREASGDLMTEEKAAVGGVDPATAMIHLQEVMTVLDASQASFVKLASMSLFDMLR